MHLELSNEGKTQQLGEALAMSCPTSPFIVALSGDLGVGKSHLARAFLKKLGVIDSIPSPTYTLCETYHITKRLSINHFDLYRLEDPEELELFGFRDMISGQGSLIEWPERAGSLLPMPDINVILDWKDTKRECNLIAQTQKGEIWLSELIWSDT